MENQFSIEKQLVESNFPFTFDCQKKLANYGIDVIFTFLGGNGHISVVSFFGGEK